MIDIYVSESHRGRIVRALRRFDVGDVVHISHVLVLPNEEVGSVLDRYVFEWTETHAAVAFGHGSIFSHSARSNVAVEKRFDDAKIVFRAKSAINCGDELTIDYGYEPEGYDGG